MQFFSVALALSPWCMDVNQDREFARLRTLEQGSNLPSPRVGKNELSKLARAAGKPLTLRLSPLLPRPVSAL